MSASHIYTLFNVRTLVISFILMITEVNVCFWYHGTFSTLYVLLCLLLLLIHIPTVTVDQMRACVVLYLLKWTSVCRDVYHINVVQICHCCVFSLFCFPHVAKNLQCFNNNRTMTTDPKLHQIVHKFTSLAFFLLCCQKYHTTLGHMRNLALVNMLTVVYYHVSLKQPGNLGCDLQCVLYFIVVVNLYLLAHNYIIYGCVLPIFQPIVSIVWKPFERQ